MPPMITTTSELSSQFESTPGARLANEPPTAPPSPASAEPTKNAIANVSWMLMPSALTICAVVDARADDHARPRLLEPEPERRARRRSRAEDEEPRRRVLHARDAQVDERVERAGPGDVLRDAAEVGEHLVGEDDRDRDRDQRLAQLLALVPAQERPAASPRPTTPTSSAPMSVGSTQLRRLTWSLVRPNTAPSPTQWRCSFERDVAAEQEEGAVRHVDDAHQAEDQREAARDDEVEPGRGDAVQRW